MHPDEPSLKLPALISLAALCILLVGSVVFYKERILFADLAYTSFLIIDHGHFNIINDRYSEVIHQFVPYFFQKLHLPIKFILIAYSMSFNLIYVIISALLIYWLKQYRLAILMGLFYFLLVSASGICANDVAFAVALMFLFWGIVLKMGNSGTNKRALYSIYFFAAFLTISTHFIIIIPLTFLWIYLIIERKYWPFTTVTTVLLSILLLIIIAYKYISVAYGPQSYDSVHLVGIKKLTFGDIFSSLSTQTVQIFIIRCWQNYWLGGVLFVAGIISLLSEKKYLLTVITLLYTLGYLIIMGIIYGGRTYDFAPTEINRTYQLWHIEVEWAALALITAAPFTFSLLPKIRNTHISSVLIAAVILIRLPYMYKYIQDFTWRINFHEHVLNKMKEKNIYKLAIHTDQERYKKFVLEWAVPFETVLISSLNNDSPRRTYFFIDPEDHKTINLVKDAKGFYDTYIVIPYLAINSEYFPIDTSQGYKISPYEEFMK